MFVAALSCGLHFQVETITNKVMPLPLWTAPLVDGGRSKTRDHQAFQNQQLAEQPDLNGLVHFWTNRLPSRLPGTNYRCHRRPGIAAIAPNGIDHVLADRIEYLFV